MAGGVGVVITIEQAPRERRTEGAHESEDSLLRSGIGEIMARRPCVGLAMGIVKGGRLDSFIAAGVADIRSVTPITEDTVFRVASITKTFTAVAVMQLWEQGIVDLDAPADQYLRAYRLIPARPGFRQATVRDLLTHTAGVPEIVRPLDALRPDWGESVAEGQRVPPLAEFYRGGLRLAAEPGTMFRYGNHGFATLGQLVEDVSGEPLDRYFRERIFEPLGMAASDLRRSESVKAQLATGYEFGRAGPRSVTPREFVTAGAASAYSSPRDMARYVAALLGGGSNGHGSVLKPATVTNMFEAQYQPDPRISGMGLGFFRIDLDGHAAVEHQGTLPGFHSQLFLAPEEGIGVMAFTNGSWLPDFWLPVESSALLGRLIGARPVAIRTDVPHRPEVWPELVGWYSLPGPLTDVRLRTFMGAGAEVFVRDGRLCLRFLTPIPALYRGFTLHADDDADPDVFRVGMSELGGASQRVVFGRTPRTAVTHVHLDLMPVSLRKQPASTNPRRWATGLLSALGMATAFTAVRRRRAAA
jgi:CubicO group peptidase (beta-lactamase class C family)